MIQHFFRFLKPYTFLSIRYILRNSIPKNRQLRPCARQSFHFQQSTGILKINIIVPVASLPSSSSESSFLRSYQYTHLVSLPPPLPMLGVGLVQGCHAAAEAVLGPMCQSSQAGPHAAAAVVAASEMAEAATTAAGAAKCCAS